MCPRPNSFAANLLRRLPGTTIYCYIYIIFYFIKVKMEAKVLNFTTVLDKKWIENKRTLAL